MSVGTAIDVLQSAVQKLKAGFDDFEIDLQKVRKRKLVDQGATSIESLRFRLVAYSRCASHGRSAPRCALRFRHFFNEGSGELEI